MENVFQAKKAIGTANTGIIQKYFEGFLVLPFLILWLWLALISKLPIVWPNTISFKYGFVAYASPLIFATFCQFLILTLYKIKKSLPWV